MFEIKYFYYNSISRGEYDKTKKISETIILGEESQDTDVKLLAAKVFSLLAKRNILVVDIEITEIKKVKVVFEEHEDGIVLNNKKYLFDGGESIVKTVAVKEKTKIENINKEETVEKTNEIPSPPAEKQTKPKLAVDSHIRTEIFNPDKDFVFLAKEKFLTIGKKYQILDEQERAYAGGFQGYVYKIINDKGKEIVIDGFHFVPVVGQISNVSPTREEANLSGVPSLRATSRSSGSMPTLRK